MRKHLRIAFSAACGMVCLLLIAWWVRSYWRFDWCQFTIVGKYHLELTSANGAIQVAAHPAIRPDMPAWFIESLPLERHPTDISPFQGALGRAVGFVNLPHWFLVILLSAIGAIPWIRRRFSLRTLMITTTLVAVVLGLIALAR